MARRSRLLPAVIVAASTIAVVAIVIAIVAIATAVMYVLPRGRRRRR
jgi:hypothetical protein